MDKNSLLKSRIAFYESLGESQITYMGTEISINKGSDGFTTFEYDSHVIVSRNPEQALKLIKTKILGGV